RRNLDRGDGHGDALPPGGARSPRLRRGLPRLHHVDRIGVPRGVHAPRGRPRPRSRPRRRGRGVDGTGRGRSGRQTPRSGAPRGPRARWEQQAETAPPSPLGEPSERRSRRGERAGDPDAGHDRQSSRGRRRRRSRRRPRRRPRSDEDGTAPRGPPLRPGPRTERASRPDGFRRGRDLPDRRRRSGMTPPPVTSRTAWASLWAMVIGFFMILVDTTIVSVAMPAMMRGLGADYTQVLWVSSAYLLTYAIPLLLTGPLGDKFGPRTVYLSGRGLFALTSSWCALAGSSASLILARAIQGLGASMMTPQTMAVITRTFPADRRGKAMSLWGATAGVAMLVGPLAGG